MTEIVAGPTLSTTRADRSVIWRGVRAVRRLPEQVLHPFRRHFAVARLRKRRAPASVLFVCYGNICRSPYAAAALLKELPETLGHAVRVTSAGFVGPHRPSPNEALAAAGPRGVDLSAHRSRLLTADAVRTAELVLVMDSRHRYAVRGLLRGDSRDVFVLGDLDPEPIERRTIHDPVGQSKDVFEQTYARIDRCLRELVRAMQQSTSR